MQTQSFIAGKDASLESTIATLLNRELRFFGEPSPGLSLEGCDMHQRLLAAYGTPRTA